MVRSISVYNSKFILLSEKSVRENSHKNLVFFLHILTFSNQGYVIRLQRSYKSSKFVTIKMTDMLSNQFVYCAIRAC